VRCSVCKESYLSNGEDPDCFDRTCPIGFDRLSRDDLRLLELRELLAALAEFNIGNRICRSFDVITDDLRMLAFIESEIKKLQPENEGQDG